MKISRNLIITLATVFLLIALPLTIYLVRQQQIFKPKAAVGDVNFTLNPETSSMTVGQDFAVNLGIASGNTDVEAVLTTLHWDPSKLRLDRFDSNNTLATDLKNEINPATGTLVYEAVDSRDAGTAKVKGTFSLGILRFRALATTTTPTQVTFDRALVGNSTATSAINTIKPTGQYTITATGGVLGNISVNVWVDKLRDGSKGSNDPFYNGVNVSLSGPGSRGPTPTDQNGNVNFTALTAGDYTVSLDLANSDLEVLNPTALSLNLTSSSLSTQIRVGPKSGSLTQVTGTLGGPPTYIVGGSSPAWYPAAVNGKNLERFEIWRVRNSGDANTIANPANWIQILDYPCGNNGYCSNNNASIGVWDNITSADAGEWIVFINGYSYNGKQCTGNPFVGNALLSGYTDCGANDVITTTVSGGSGGLASPSPSVASCPANATTCWMIGGVDQACTNQQGSDNWCALHHQNSSTCDHVNPGTFGDGCSVPNCAAIGQIFCSRLARCASSNECNPVASQSPAASVVSCTQSNGDANKDGAVNLLDYTIWGDEILGIRSTKLADFNCDGAVNLLDHNIWRTTIIGQNP